jgi:hypothetical protein
MINAFNLKNPPKRFIVVWEYTGIDGIIRTLPSKIMTYKKASKLADNLRVSEHTISARIREMP